MKTKAVVRQMFPPTDWKELNSPTKAGVCGDSKEWGQNTLGTH